MSALNKIGFSPNQSGGYWYREAQNRYTVQIIPVSQGWGLGIADQGGMRWGKKVFDSPVAAARHAFDYLQDSNMAFRLQRAVAEQVFNNRFILR